MAVRDVVQAAAGALGQATYIEDVFSTYLYTGNGSTQTITNGIDLDGEGGLVWIKNRAAATFSNHQLHDTVRGPTKFLRTNTTEDELTENSGITSFNSDGFTRGNSAIGNQSGVSYASWTFRKQPKFFDVVTYTGDGNNARAVSHSLASVPGAIFIKRTDSTSDWFACVRQNSTNYAAGGGSGANFALNSTNRAYNVPISNVSTSTTFKPFDAAGGIGDANVSGGTYVAYLFAHDAGGFGDDGSENVISCGSFTTDGSGNATVNLGYEPQFLILKQTNASGNWSLIDNMRSWTANGSFAVLYPNLSNAEATSASSYFPLSATGFNVTGFGGGLETYIYIAIRRGPMKTPTTGTEVFTLDASSAGSSGGLMGALSASDLVINSQRDTASDSPFVFVDRLRGVGQVNTGSTTKALYSSSTAAETTVDTTSTSSTAPGVNGAYLYSAVGKNSAIRTVQQGSGGSVAYNLIRAPGFFDVVCYTCNTQTAPITSNHNLGVVPEMIIVKKRATTGDWPVYHVSQGNTKFARFNTTSIFQIGSGYWNNTSPTETQFTVGTDGDVNSGTGGAVAYLFATVAGVSKVGSYTGTGTTQQINCSFSAGARFVLIKRADDVGDWYVWDSARGIVAGNDPYLLLNSTAAEVTSTDYVDTYSAGFEISSTAPAAINASGGTFIFLAVS